MARNRAGGSQQKREIPSLTGLRGVAALCVVFSHFWFWTSVTPVNQLPTTPWVDTSTIGMAIFFTLSGYVIALSYSHWDWRGRPVYSLIKLFFYRFARLYPAFLLFAVIVVVRVVELQDWRDADVQHYVGMHLLLLQSWLPVRFGGVLSPDDHFHVSWSLSVECALYLLFGLGAILVAVLPAWRGRAATLGIAFFVVVVTAVLLGWFLRDIVRPAGINDYDYYRWLFLFSPAAISLQFGIGVAAWKVSTLSIRPSVASMVSNCGLIGLVAVHVLLSTRLVAGGESREGLFTAMATALVLVGSSADSIANRFLSIRPLLFLGTISYSFYLFHFLAPPMALHGRHYATYDATAMAWHAVNFAASLGLAILLATGAYVLVETPGRRLIRAGADRLLAALSASSMTEAQPRAEQARSS